MSTATTVRFTDEERAAIQILAKRQRRSVSEVIRQATLDRVEDEYDLMELRAAVAEHKKNPVTYSLDEVKEYLGL